MNKEKKLTCDNCGIAVDKYSYGSYCETCAGEVWDRGFEVTSEWAEQSAHTDSKLSLDCDYQENPEEFEKEIRYIQDSFETEQWYCNKCKQVRLTIDQQASMKTEQVVSELKKPCPKCGVQGYLDHNFRPS